MKKPKKINIGIMPFKDYQAYTMAIARGEIRPAPGDPKIWIESEDARRQIIEQMRQFRGMLPDDFRFDRDEANER